MYISISQLGGKIKSWHKRYFVLKCGVLSYWKSQVLHIVKQRWKSQVLYILSNGQNSPNTKYIAKYSMPSSLILEVTGTSYCQTDKIVQTANTLPSTQCTTITTSYFPRNLKSIYCASCRLSLMQTMQTSD